MEYKIATYRGKPIESLTKEELITVLNEQAQYFESRLADKDKIINRLSCRDDSNHYYPDYGSIGF